MVPAWTETCRSSFYIFNVFLITYSLYNWVHYFVNKAFDIVDARCNNEDYYIGSYISWKEWIGLIWFKAGTIRWLAEWQLAIRVALLSTELVKIDSFVVKGVWRQFYCQGRSHIVSNYVRFWFLRNSSYRAVADLLILIISD